MPVAAQDVVPMLATQRGNPKVIDWDGRAGALEFEPDFGVMERGPLIHWQHGWESIREPLFMLLTFPRLQDAEPILAEHDRWNEQCFVIRKPRPEGGIAFGKDREGVRVENQVQSSGSICSNSCSTICSILRRSSLKCRNSPKPAIHGLSA